MAWTGADVEKWLGQAAGSFDSTILARLVAAVTAKAGREFDLSEPDDDSDQALIMQTARLWQRRYSADGLAGAGSDDLAPIRIPAFDNDVQQLLSSRLKVAGLFGPTATAE